MQGPNLWGREFLNVMGRALWARLNRISRAGYLSIEGKIHLERKVCSSIEIISA